MEELFPVVNPVLVLSLGCLNGSFSDIHAPARDFLQALSYLVQHFLLIRIRLQIKADIGHAVVRRSLRQNIHEHLLLFSLGQGNLVLDLNSLDSHILHHTADEIFCLRPGLQCVFIPFHKMHLSYLLRHNEIKYASRILLVIAAVVKVSCKHRL